jgi:hypothetical protein
MSDNQELQANGQHCVSTNCPGDLTDMSKTGSTPVIFYEELTENTVIISFVRLDISCPVVHKYHIFKIFIDWDHDLDFFFTIQDGDLVYSCVCCQEDICLFILKDFYKTPVVCILYKVLCSKSTALHIGVL